MMPQGKEEKQAERKPAWLPGFLAKGRNKKATKPLRLNPKTPGAHREDMSQDDVLRLHEAAREYPTSNCHATVGMRTPGWQGTCKTASIIIKTWLGITEKAQNPRQGNWGGKNRTSI
ncbi:hypothetical protein H112_00145 [Trichophyton rubrum D6]|uniref:Uncharacterized protein n=2 Tax=Trichophyton TaxID=5550 RepID=A0A022WHR2_TRIRU|nr:hypothetical protein H100_00144 [Trichophyton rubrum MR850]EZF57616.1 hypothetical protein H103_00145 [Trichophyton rubrum CBS 288.86]EZF68180.1 hypothetical protein H104_00144 [Trichophyton rubrum CBS 289.86]EZF78887.1 hypothetical protein H105_00134 [Trichophyton soudanense CBS 452.61]EZG21902.1 hypothetical protein H107_00147 [Trichophyton rubrum CBS 202.88]KDB38727.1 hypothetical protein H112_00145 [Trichophyton rubrum D6]KMQ44314.1 hypothetical protein HL42_4982 [Trichophyton rubrum]